MGRIGIRIANVVLFVLSCFLAANLINQVAGALLIPEESAPVPRPSRSEGPHETADPLQTILDRNLFDAHVGQERIPVIEKQVEEKLAATKLPLRLLGTVASDDAVISSAAIEQTALRQSEVVRVGDELKHQKNVTVEAIERGRVILLNGTAREELRLAEEDGPSVSPASRSSMGKRTSRRSRRTRNTAGANNTSSSLDDKLKQLAKVGGGRDAASVFTGGRTLPKMENGKMVGIELSEVVDDGFYDKIGLANGDVITEVNGMQLNTPSATRELLRIFSEESNLVAKVRTSEGEKEIARSRQEIMDMFSE